MYRNSIGAVAQRQSRNLLAHRRALAELQSVVSCFADEGITTGVGVPIRSDGRVVGVLASYGRMHLSFVAVGYAPVHEAQLLTYLKHTGIPIGLLLNFNTPVLRDGLRRLHLNVEANPRL